jgi:hypothetical protein
MGWDQRGYYYRARKLQGRVVREYVGAGIVGELAAEVDALERERRADARAVEKAERGRLDALDASVDELDTLPNRLVSAALQAAGFHKHKRGEWRKRGNTKGTQLFFRLKRVASPLLFPGSRHHRR